MKVSWAWIKDWVDLRWSAQEASEKLAELGFPVDAVRPTGLQTDLIVAARILDVAKHPHADRLSLAEVDDGTGTRRVVCGAPNIAPRQTVPLALPGAELPGGIKITASKIRGVESHGMLCSARELGMSDDHSGIYQLSSSLAPGTNLRTSFPRDAVMDVDVTPNRPDALSHVGLARELAAVSSKKLKMPRFRWKPGKTGPSCRIRITNPSICSRYIGRIIRGVKVGPSPEWLVRRLHLCGIRSINNVVDVTNYVLLEWGHPLHAFDLARLEGGEIVVRNAEPGETVAALDEKTYTLDSTDIVIADRSKPVAIAGIMGGARPGVTEQTTDILLESAVFDRVAVRQTSRRLNLKSESSIRFEKGTDPETADRASLRAAELILNLTGGTPGRQTDCYPKKISASKIVLRPSRVSSLSGTTFASSKIKALLGRLEIKTVPKGKNLICEIPSYRKDLLEEVDLIEEVVRLHGYDALPTRPPQGLSGEIPSEMVLRDTRWLVQFLKSAGLSQTISSSFSSPEGAAQFGFAPSDLISLANPLSMEESVLRPLLAPQLIRAVKRNANYQRATVRLFEIGRRFRFDTEKNVREDAALGTVLYGLSEPKRWNRPERVVDFFELKGLVESLIAHHHLDLTLNREGAPEFLHPHQSFVVLKNGVEVGWGGILHPRLQTEWELKFPLALMEAVLDGFETKRREGGRTSDFPFVERDVALLVGKDVRWAELEAVVRKEGGPLLKEVVPFDLFSGGSIPTDKKSVAFRLTIQSGDRTLEESDISGVVDQIKKGLQSAVGVEFR